MSNQKKINRIIDAMNNNLFRFEIADIRKTIREV